MGQVIRQRHPTDGGNPVNENLPCAGFCDQHDDADVAECDKDAAEVVIDTAVTGGVQRIELVSLETRRADDHERQTEKELP